MKSTTWALKSRNSTTTTSTMYAQTRFCSPGASHARAVTARRPGPASQAATTKRSPTTIISRNEPRMSSVRMFQALFAACRSSSRATSESTT